jgi:hypothetical protein
MGTSAATGIEEIGAEIIAETDALREKNKIEYASDPEAELLVWLQIAVQREAMVCQLYSRASRDRRIEDVETGVPFVAKDALTLIWQQEKSHAGILAARLIDGVFAGRTGALGAACRKLKGRLDGAMLDVLTAAEGGYERTLAQAMAWVAARLAPGQVPAFVTRLPQANLREYFLLAAALERTAKDSYERMAEILPPVIINSSSMQPQGLLKPVEDTGKDETFHQLAFTEMASWLALDGTFKEGLDDKACVKTLRKILSATTGVRAFEGAAPSTFTSDGGLGPLFRRYGLEVVVEEKDAGATT